MLKRRRADGSSLIKVDQLRDGIVLFEDVVDAEQYSSYMEAETTAQARFAEDLCTAGSLQSLSTGTRMPTQHDLDVVFT